MGVRCKENGEGETARGGGGGVGREVEGTYSLPLPFFAFLSTALHFSPLSGTKMEPRLTTTPFIRPPRYYDHIHSTQT